MFSGTDDEKELNPAIVAFVIRLLAITIENEWTFTVVKEKQFLDKYDLIDIPFFFNSVNKFVICLRRIQSALKENQKLQTPSIKLANIILLSAIAKHSVGLHWIKRSNSWKTVVEYCQKNHTLYVVRESKIFLYDILHKFSTKDDELTSLIIKEILEPLITCTSVDQNNVVLVDDSILQQKITPTLNLICYLLENSIIRNDSKRIVYHLLVTYRIEIIMWKLSDMTHDHLFLGTMFRVFVVLFLALSAQDDNEISMVNLNINKFSINFFNIVKFCLNRRSCANIYKTAEYAEIIWNKLITNLPEVKLLDNQNNKLEDQMIMLQLIPIMCGITKKQFFQTEIFENFIFKIFNISSELTIRLCYSYRDLLLTVDNVSELAIKSIQSILSVKTILDRDRAIIVLQALIFALKGYIPNKCDKESMTTSYSSEEQEGAGSSSSTSCTQTPSDRCLTMRPNLLSAILIGLHTLISHYKITWNECIESTILLNFMLSLLYNPNMGSRECVQALKLTQLSIEHFLSPNLALLVDTVKGSGLECLGPMIMKRLHDNSWETRDSTIELLLAMVSISDLSKFKPNNKILT